MALGVTILKHFKVIHLVFFFFFKWTYKTKLQGCTPFKSKCLSSIVALPRYHNVFLTSTHGAEIGSPNTSQFIYGIFT